jgi:hypothetical protein
MAFIEPPPVVVPPDKVPQPWPKPKQVGVVSHDDLEQRT